MRNFRCTGADIPGYMQGWVEDWVNHRDPGGHFFSAVLCNDLKSACQYADEASAQHLTALVRVLYNQAPASCWGSHENYQAWLDARTRELA